MEEYSIFINSSLTFDEIIDTLGKLLDVVFVKEEDELWSSAYFSGLGLTIRVIGDLDYEDDLGIQFSRYAYQLSVDCYTRVRNDEYWLGLEYHMTMYIYSRICEKLDWKCMVIKDMQTLIDINGSDS